MGFHLPLAVLPAGLCLEAVSLSVLFICGWCWVPGVPGRSGMGQGSCQCDDGDGDRAELPQPIQPALSHFLFVRVGAGAGVPKRSLERHYSPGRAAPGARLAAAVHSHSNPKILLKHCPSILEHRLVAGKGTLVLGRLFSIFLEISPLHWLLPGISGEIYIFLKVHSIRLLLNKQGSLYRCSQSRTERINQVALYC